MDLAGWHKHFWTVSTMALAVAGAGSLTACAAEEAPEEMTDEAEEELRLFPDPRCRGPIEMSKRSYAALPAGYEQLTATEKQKALWKVVGETPYVPGCRPSSGLFLAALAAPNTISSMATTLDRSSDELPIGRRKMLHTFGAVATFDFVKDAGAPAYTGMLEPGGAPVKGILRASLGGDPNVLGFTPGIAVKFLADGKPSVNVVAMHSLMGQKRDTNFFRHPFTNEVPDPHTGLSRGANWLDWAKADTFTLGTNLALVPAMARGPEAPTPNFLRVDHVATRSPDGRVVPEDQRKHPSHLVFRAPGALVSFWDHPGHGRLDYRDMLAKLPVGTVLYEVYGRATPSSPEVRIGVLRTTSVFVSSTWGDYRLFFRHNDHQKNGDVGR